MKQANGSRRRSFSWIVLAGLMVGLAALLLELPAAGWAKDFELTGTVDCGRRSGQRCTIGDTLAIITEDLSGVKERVVVDVSWIQPIIRQREIDQDDTLCLEVGDRPDGGLRAIGFTDVCDGKGTDNPGLSNEDDDTAEQGNDNDDDD
ncbi:MAG: hypothetical protein ACKVVP_04695 [Chloroflexota bacterium]